MTEGTQRRLAAIASADVAGYPRLMRADKFGTLVAIRAHRKELWNSTIERIGGRVGSRRWSINGLLVTAVRKNGADDVEQAVRFNSDGIQIAGVIFEPEAAADSSCPGVVLCQGMIGVKEYFWFPTIARRLAEMGYVALIWDYRGVGESEGEPGRLYPLEQSNDIRNGLTFLETNPLVDPDRLALLGFSFGAGMVPYVAGIDARVKCAVSVVGWGDGRRWMRSVRRQSEWLDLLRRIDVDRKARVATGKSELMGHLGGILAGDPATAAVGEEVIKNIPGMENAISTDYSLATAEKLLEFKPVEVVERISPRAIMFIAAELDAVTPADDVMDMYDRAGEPKKLWVIPGAAHYDVYRDELMEKILDMSVAWMAEHMPTD